MQTKHLGIIALIGAPFLLIDTVNNGFSPYVHSSISGCFNMIYITAWICSLIALRRIGAFGEDRFSKTVFILQLVFLSLADCWNLYEILKPGHGTVIYYVLDAFWPISNLCMFVTGLVILLKGNLEGWRRIIPLLVGCWIPVSLIFWFFMGRSEAMLAISNIYSAVMWSLMAIIAITGSQSAKQKELAPGSAAWVA
jgi:hypothetical protein